jgi:glycosyltransferase involved in cell wall biosynthesis
VTDRHPLRVHLIHQGFADYVGGLIDGLTRPQRVVGPGSASSESAPIDLRVTTIRSGQSSGVALRDVPGEHQSINLPRFRDPRSLPAAALALRRVLAQSADVVHWQAAGNPWVDAAFLPLMGRTPTVVTVHDMQPHPGDHNTLPGTFRALRAVARRADRVIVHAPHVEAQGRAAGIAADRVRVLAHGELGSRYVEPGRLPLPASPSDRPTVLFFGRAQGYKGLDVLAAAMPEVAAKVPGCRLVVAGAGPSLDQVFPADGPQPEWLEVLRGRVDDDEVVRVFTEASVVALPYREASQSGVAALAAGFGRPVVASAVPGLQDIVEPGVTGTLVEPDSVSALTDELVSMLTRPEQLAELGAGAAQAAAGRLSWQVIASETIRLYHEATGVTAHGRDGRLGGVGPESGSAPRPRPKL